MSMGIEFYIDNPWYGPPWYSFLVLVFIFLIMIFGLGFLEKFVVDFWHGWCDRKSKADFYE